MYIFNILDDTCDVAYCIGDPIDSDLNIWNHIKVR